MTPLALRCSALDHCVTRALSRTISWKLTTLLANISNILQKVTLELMFCLWEFNYHSLHSNAKLATNPFSICGNTVASYSDFLHVTISSVCVCVSQSLSVWISFCLLCVLQNVGSQYTVAMEIAPEDVVIQETLGAEVELLEDVIKTKKQSPPVSCLNRVDTGQRL